MSYFHRASAMAPILVALGLAPSLHAQTMSDMDMGQMAMPAATSGWHLSTHGQITTVGDHQSGPRGGSKTFVEGMVMLMAHRSLSGNNDIDLQLMLSPDPFMGKSGYPLLLQTGETANGVTPLVDRQHPHDLIAGMTATLTHHVDDQTSASISAGYPGDFAFGPTAFMHRASGENFPTAPITHHWLDSGHITMGVVTAGFAKGPVKLEISAFTGREPDQNRFNLDPIHLDSTSLRATWQVTPDLSAEASWARQVSPEQLEPQINLIKQAISFDYGRSFGVGRLDTTVALGHKAVEHGSQKASDGYLFENTLQFNGPWIGLARYERVYNDELITGHAYWVGKSEVGVIRTFDLSKTTRLGLGVSEQINAVPDALKPAYGNHPVGTLVFMQIRFHNGDTRPMAGMDM